MADFTFLKGNIETIILCSLYNRDKYGYEIARDIKDRTENAYEIKQPTLYSYLKRLEDDDLIESYWGTESNGGRRRYYKLTANGRVNCEKFVSEWEFQRTVLSNLVDGTTEASELTQEEVTPMFGRRSQRKRKINKASFEQQDELEAMLDMLDGGKKDEPQSDIVATDETVEEPASVIEETIAEEPIIEEAAVEVTEETAIDEPVVDAQPTAATPAPQTDAQQQPPVVVNVVFQNVGAQPQQTPSTVEQQTIYPPQDTTVSTDFFYQPPVEPTTAATVAEQPQQPQPMGTTLDRRGIFDVKQDDADDFIQGFDALVRDASERQTPTNESASNEGMSANYQHVLMGVLGSQLDDAQNIDNVDYSVADLADRPVQLEEIADNFAQDGIRLRIYNQATANYKPKQLMPHCKILAQTGWLTYLFACIYFGILTAITSADVRTAFIVTLSVLIVAPIVLWIVAFVNNGKQPKPKFNFRLTFIVACVVALIVLLISASISFFGGIEFGEFDQVATKILLPFGIALLFPISLFIYNLFYRRY